jgi:cytochrome b561
MKWLMKWILFLLYLLIMQLVISGYSVVFDAYISGKSIAVFGYKLLWTAKGAGFILFWQWVFNE